MQISVNRCRLGIPTVTADGPEGLAFGQGAATAQDRAWQLTVDAWRLGGLAEEALGAEHRGLDELVSAVDLPGIARRCLERAEPRARDYCAAYARGVNEHLAAGLAGDPLSRGAALPAPEWEEWTPVGMMLLAHLLFGAFPESLWRLKAGSALGEERARAFLSDPVLTSGSNAWLVPGSLTSTGRPLLCADPHRLLEWPGPYQQVRLRAPGIEADGLAFPGFPGVPHFGQTPSAAWAVTNAMADSQPLVRLGPGAGFESPARSAPGDDDGGPCGREHDGGWPVVAHDAHGPLGLAWSADRIGDGGLGTSLALLTARSTEDVAEAFAAWTDPVDDVLAADAAGSAVRFTAGRVPRLDPEARARPLSPGELEAAGWEEFEVRPLHAPEAAANERKADGPRLGWTYCSPQRALRIRELLHGLCEAGPVRPEDAAGIAADTLDAELRSLVRALLGGPVSPSDSAPAADREAVEGVGEVGEAVGESVEAVGEATEALRQRLLAWDGRFEADSEAAGEVAAWRHELVRIVAGLPAFASLFEESGLRPVGGELFAPWLDPLVRIGLSLPGVLARADLFGFDAAEAARQAVVVLAEKQSVRRTWGETHLAVPLVTSAAAEPRPAPVGVGGDAQAVLSAGSIPGVADACLRAPVARVLWDVGAPERSAWVIPWGASGRLDSPHSGDQTSAWAAGRLFPVAASS
ncbi:penicillin acylase family protein [Arthrobacter sp. UM1]|uniref:penicillin acylase family protein n=1 Tax=Arthrobacter sp. UM1 TaxID=2766776 RepID=UPI001CF6DA09|nr:penicillin acylase family protein [Arthrobacter sp. UM1]MCB4208392.1 penicillin acylase family protein [Arthrobacter sp. UM1]